MELRNKKTGEIYDKVNIHVSPWKIGTRGLTSFDYNSVDKFNEEWEDYVPKEPLIKDEKVRKAVRAWADVNGIERVWHEYSSNWLRGNGLRIELENGVVELEQGNYSIEELCGEEE